MNDKHVAAVKALVEEDGRYTVKDIHVAKSVGISEGSVNEMLSIKLELKRSVHVGCLIY